jgi:NAD(P)-dependent dehydrogenase (short-subunit alcohol dehydrogenase family)
MQFAIYPSLKGKSVFITGGASGIGKALVEHFCAQGSRVKFIDIDVQAGTSLAERLAVPADLAPVFAACDVRDVAQLKAEIIEFAATAGGLDVLLNNAGADDRHAAMDVDVDYWESRMRINLRHQFFAAQAAAGEMRRGGGGSIVNFGSTMVRMGSAGAVGYVTAKGGIEAMTRALAREFGRDRIRVNCLVPGWIMTERQIALYVDDRSDAVIAERQCIPEKLYPEDVARMTLFLAADDSRHVTSQNFIVDGGWV